MLAGAGQVKWGFLEWAALHRHMGTHLHASRHQSNPLQTSLSSQPFHPALSSFSSQPPYPFHTHPLPSLPHFPPFSFVRQQGPSASGIIYCLSRNEAEGVAGYLREAGRINAAHYHAGMTHK